MVISGFFFQAEDGIRDLVRSRGLGDVYKRQGRARPRQPDLDRSDRCQKGPHLLGLRDATGDDDLCLLYTSDAADERSSVDLGGRRIIKKKKTIRSGSWEEITTKRQITASHITRTIKRKIWLVRLHNK